MNIHISIDYATAPGERPVLCVAKPVSSRIVMQSNDGRSWRCDLTAEGDTLAYNFEIAGADGKATRREWRTPHVVLLGKGVENAKIADRWHDSPPYAPMLSSAFTGSIFRRTAADTASLPAPDGSYVEFQVLAPQVEPGQTLVMAGSAPALGAWLPASAPRLDDSRFPLWTMRFAADALPSEFEYKFCIVDSATGEAIRWEETDNRRHCHAAPGAGEAEIVMGMRFEQQASWRGTGTVIPVFSLRSADSFGIGDFHDLGLMVDWVAATGQNVLQILPVNDTTMSGRWSDSYPYNAISVFALHPIYLKVEELGLISDSSESLFLATEKKTLNSLARIDYEKVFAAKMEYARIIFRQNGKATLTSLDYLKFVGKNHEWLDAYAAFCVLRDRYATADFTQWGEYAVYDAAKAGALMKEAPEETDFYRWLQYHLHRQLKAVTAHARSLGVVIKGDIPIGISRNSVDAWQYPHLFNLDWCAGAPPDAFATDGQNWGFPTYNWERMAEDDYAWWRARLRKMAEYFDAYRIDHLLGFFRIWQIPRSKRSGLLGIFYPALPFSPEEMKERFGFDFDPAMAQPHTKPTDLLFIEDTAQECRYHPAIDGPKTELFKALDPGQQECYRRLHNDFFYFRHNTMWDEQAMKKLTPLLSETAMLACGEDLGMIPACVKPVMDRLRILSLEVQRMPKTYGEEWADTFSYPYLSVATTSTHDMPGLRLWMEENPQTARRLLDSLGLTVTDSVSTPECCEAVIRAHLESPSMLCILPWQDWMSIDGKLRRKEPADEVINIPAVANHYWRYRMHLDIEQLLGAEELNDHIRQLVGSTR